LIVSIERPHPFVGHRRNSRAACTFHWHSPRTARRQPACDRGGRPCRQAPDLVARPLHVFRVGRRDSLSPCPPGCRARGTWHQRRL